MTHYAVGILREVRMGPPIVEYLERIDATLAPFDGHFLVHGGDQRQLEGETPGSLIVIEFPDAERAEAWYTSPDYQAILPLRTENADGSVFLVNAAGPDHKATDVLA